MSAIMLAFDHKATTALWRRQLITAHEAAVELWQLLLREHPFLVHLGPDEGLASIAGLPREIAGAYHAIEPRTLAEQLLAGGDLAHNEARVVPLLPGIALRMARVDSGAEGERPHYIGHLVSVGGRLLPTDGPHFVGPWFSRRPHTLIVLALDDARALDALVADSRPAMPMPAARPAI